MKRTWILGALLTSAVYTSAIADEYYIVQDVFEKQCAIVESPPATTELVLVENGNVHFNRDEAERVMAAIPQCMLPTSTAASAEASTRTVKAKPQHSTKSKRQVTAYKRTGRPAVFQQAQVNRSSESSLSSFFTLFR